MSNSDKDVDVPQSNPQTSRLETTLPMQVTQSESLSRNERLWDTGPATPRGQDAL